jgi:hypothetical protein
MRRYVARANADHYLAVLKDPTLSIQQRGTATSLLAAELDKLGHDADHLEFAESKVAISRQQIAQATSIRNSHAAGTSQRQEADRHVIHLENVHTLLDDFCHRLRNHAAHTRIESERAVRTDTW